MQRKVAADVKWGGTEEESLFPVSSTCLGKKGREEARESKQHLLYVVKGRAEGCRAASSLAQHAPFPPVCHATDWTQTDGRHGSGLQGHRLSTIALCCHCSVLFLDHQIIRELTVISGLTVTSSPTVCIM